MEAKWKNKCRTEQRQLKSPVIFCTVSKMLVSVWRQHALTYALTDARLRQLATLIPHAIEFPPFVKILSNFRMSQLQESICVVKMSEKNL